MVTASARAQIQDADMSRLAAEETCAEPDPKQLKQHLDIIVEAFAKAGEDCLVELRMLDPAEKAPAISRSFRIDQRDGMIATALQWNKQGRNVYVGLCPRRSDMPRRKAGTAEHVIAGVVQAVDADTAESIELLKDYSGGPKHTFEITTGTTPHRRGWGCWELEEPISVESWSDGQRILQRRFKTDKIDDAPRIGRLAGLISYPSQRKRERGYVVELVQIRVHEDRDPVTPMAIRQFINGRDLADTAARFEALDTGDHVDLEAELEICRRNEGGWRNAMKRILAHLFGLGWKVERVTNFVKERGALPEGLDADFTGLVAWFAGRQPNIADANEPVIVVDIDTGSEPITDGLEEPIWSLTKPPGLVGDLMDYGDSIAFRHTRLASLAGALIATSVIAGNQAAVAMPRGAVALNLFGLLVSPTGVGKENARHICRDALPAPGSSERFDAWMPSSYKQHICAHSGPFPSFSPCLACYRPGPRALRAGSCSTSRPDPVPTCNRRSRPTAWCSS